MAGHLPLMRVAEDLVWQGVSVSVSDSGGTRGVWCGLLVSLGGWPFVTTVDPGPGSLVAGAVVLGAAILRLREGPAERSGPSSLLGEKQHRAPQSGKHRPSLFLLWPFQQTIRALSSSVLSLMLP